MKALITTIPFEIERSIYVKKLKKLGIEIISNPKNSKFSRNELISFGKDCDFLIAGTDKLDKFVLNKLKNLKLISRVGVGYDNIDMDFCNNHDIKVTITPEAPVSAVSELTIGLIFSLLRSIHLSNEDIHHGRWLKYMGEDIFNKTIGIVGYGKIGQSVRKKLKGLGVKDILVNENNKKVIKENKNVFFVSKNEILERSDILTLHLPLNKLTKHFLSKKEFSKMKKSSYFINTSRGQIINEKDLVSFLKKDYFKGVALDVFSEEPYLGPLSDFSSCLLTSHLGPMTSSSRSQMENESLQEVIRFIGNKKLKNQI